MSYFNSPRIVTDGLVLCLDAGNTKSYPGSGTTWTDLSRNGNNGTLTNGPSYTSSFGGGVVLDGTNDFIVGTNNTGISGTGARTLSTWVYPTDMINDGYYSIARIGAGTNFQLFEILISRSNFTTYSITLHIWGGNELGGVVEKTLLFNNSNIACSYDGTTAYMYLDGKLAFSANRTLATANSTFTLGSPAYGAHRYFKGNISNTSLYNRALSPTEILQNYNATRGRFGL
jgi:hypothetical protein